MLQAEKRFVMTRITKITACLICICAVFGTASCGKKASLPDVRDLGQILTVSREEGSGTRTEFDMNLKVTEQNADQVVSSTKDMLETVASTKNAIGYVAYSAIANELDSGITADDKTDNNDHSSHDGHNKPRVYLAFRDDWLCHHVGREVISACIVRSRLSSGFVGLIRARKHR